MMSDKVTADTIRGDLQNAFAWLKVHSSGSQAYQASRAAEARVMAFLAQCETEPATEALIAALRERLKAMGDEDRYYALEEITRGYCLHCGSDDGGECTCMRDE